jgi:hypothetical protein
MQERVLGRAGRAGHARTGQVLVADAPHTFAWRTVPTRRFPDSSEWRVELVEVDSGTRITQSFQVVRAPALLATLYATIVPTHRDRGTGLTDDLRRLGELAAEDAHRARTRHLDDQLRV